MRKVSRIRMVNNPAFRWMTGGRMSDRRRARYVDQRSQAVGRSKVDIAV